MRLVKLFFLFSCIVSYGQRSDFPSIDFTKADSIALLYQGESLANLPVLTHKLTADLSTDVEKFRAIYTWVGTNIENDYSAYLTTRKKRKKFSKNPEALSQWNTSFTPKVFQNLIEHKRTACTGYAYLIREMANLININCKIIDGYGRTATLSLDDNSLPNHSWNAVELNGKWYLCDATWSAGSVDLEEDGPKFKSDYHDGYFLADPALFVKNHYPLDLEWILSQKPPTFRQFLDGPIVYKEAFSPNVIPIEPGTMQLKTLKNEAVLFKLTTLDTSLVERIGLLLVNGSYSNSIQPEVTQGEGEYVFSHSFKKAGLFDLHVRVDDAIVATYVVKVKRK